MIKKTLYLFAISLLLIQCKSTEKSTKDKEAAATEIEEGKNVTQDELTKIVGQSYRGILPCADCMGIETELAFKADGQYVVKSFYLGKSDEVNSKTGQYQLDGNKVICRIKSQIVSRYQIKEDQLVPEGPQASSMSGTEEQYILRKNLGQLVERYWALTEVLGEEAKPLAEGREAYLLVRNDGSFSASGGCNSLFGSFSETTKHFIQFNEIASSEMACNYPHYDKSLIEALERTRQFMVNKNDELVLVVGKAAPLARFKKVGL